jgi:hypothetical protein
VHRCPATCADADLVVVAITRIEKATCDEKKEEEALLWRWKVEIYKRGDGALDSLLGTRSDSRLTFCFSLTLLIETVTSPD